MGHEYRFPRFFLKELEVPAYRKICLAMKEKKSASLAVTRFLEYLPYQTFFVCVHVAYFNSLLNAKTFAPFCDCKKL